MMERILRIRYSAGILISLILITGILIANADDGVGYANDGRLNAIFHMGGSAIYCVNRYLDPTSSYDDGGIRVLSINGQEQMFVPASKIAETGDHPAVDTMLAESTNAYGVLRLFRLTGGEFMLNGIDEHGNPFWFIFKDCLPQGPAVSGSSGGGGGRPGSPNGTEESA